MCMGLLHHLILRLNAGLGSCRTSLEDERPVNATDEEMCNKVRHFVYSDRRIKVEDIAHALGISHGTVLTILHGRLGMRKLTARWVFWVIKR